MAVSTDPQDHPVTLDLTGETSPYAFADDERSLFGYGDVFQAFPDAHIAVLTFRSPDKLPVTLS